MTRFPRSTREAFPIERFPAVEVYRSPWLARWWRLASYVTCFGLLAGIGLMLAWRG